MRPTPMISVKIISYPDELRACSLGMQPSWPGCPRRLQKQKYLRGEMLLKNLASWVRGLNFSLMEKSLCRNLGFFWTLRWVEDYPLIKVSVIEEWQPAILDPVYTRGKVSGFVKISGSLVSQAQSVYTAQPHTAISSIHEAQARFYQSYLVIFLSILIVKIDGNTVYSKTIREGKFFQIIYGKSLHEKFNFVGFKLSRIQSSHKHNIFIIIYFIFHIVPTKIIFS